MKKCKPFKFSDLANRIAIGIREGDTSIKKLNINHATVQRIYKGMKEDNYKGCMVFYVCGKLCDYVLGDTKDGLNMLARWNKPFPTDDELISHIVERDADVLFCALQGALLQLRKGEVESKCFKVIYALYQSLQATECE